MDGDWVEVALASVLVTPAKACARATPLPVSPISNNLQSKSLATRRASRKSGAGGFPPLTVVDFGQSHSSRRHSSNGPCRGCDTLQRFCLKLRQRNYAEIVQKNGELPTGSPE